MKFLKDFKTILLTCVLTSLFGLAISTTVFADGKSPQTSTATLNINTANAKVIANTMKGVGLKKAEAIVEYREKFGDFHDIQELSEVKGIGKATIEKNMDIVSVK